MNNLIFDAGPLITACKFSVADQLVIDHLLNHCQITIATSVRDEVVVAGKRYPDAQAAQKRIDDGRVAVLSPLPNPSLETLIAPYNLGYGEQDSIRLVGHVALQNAILVVDDHLAYLVSDRLGQQKSFLLDVIANLAAMERLDRSLAEDMVKSIQTRYPPAFVKHTMFLLRR